MVRGHAKSRPFNLAPAVGSLYIAAWKQGLDPCQ